MNSDPSLRTDVIHRFSPMVSSPGEVVPQLLTQEDVTIRRAMLLAVGEMLGPSDEQTDRSLAIRSNAPAAQMLLELYRDDPDPGVHSAARWALYRYGRASDVAGIDRGNRALGSVDDRQWYVNSQGHTMVAIAGPTHFMMGSPESEAGRRDDERLHSQRIRRSYHIASEETTIEQFNAFLRENPSIEERFSRAGDRKVPQAAVTWYDAVAYCNWLSEKEDIPRDQRCYVPNSKGEWAAGMRIPPNFLSRRGYRLPTEAEWEFAAPCGNVHGSVLRKWTCLSGSVCSVPGERAGWLAPCRVIQTQ